MKNLLFLFAFMAFCLTANAQAPQRSAGGFTNKTTGTPIDPTAILDLKTAKKVALFPEMNETERDTLFLEPTEGSLYFSNSGTKGLFQYLDYEWKFIGAGSLQSVLDYNASAYNSYIYLFGDSIGGVTPETNITTGNIELINYNGKRVITNFNDTGSRIRVRNVVNTLNDMQAGFGIELGFPYLFATDRITGEGAVVTGKGATISNSNPGGYITTYGHKEISAILNSNNSYKKKFSIGEINNTASGLVVETHSLQSKPFREAPYYLATTEDVIEPTQINGLTSMLASKQNKSSFIRQRTERNFVSVNGQNVNIFAEGANSNGTFLNVQPGFYRLNVFIRIEGFNPISSSLLFSMQGDAVMSDIHLFNAGRKGQEAATNIMGGYSSNNELLLQSPNAGTTAYFMIEAEFLVTSAGSITPSIMVNANNFNLSIKPGTRAFLTQVINGTGTGYYGDVD